jgi:hypothetical protein
MGTDNIRAIIHAAKQHEQRTGHLRDSFQEHLEALRSSLLLPEDNAAASLVAFVEQYIDYVPVFIDSVTESSRARRVYDYVAPFLHMAEDYFLAPPEQITENSGLQALLDEAFLAQRLIEEANDRHIRDHQTPLLPLDMTRANIIVHHLLGDSLANRLDALVEQTVTRLIDRERLFDRGRFENYEQVVNSAPWQDLPCLSRNASVDLRLERV